MSVESRPFLRKIQVKIQTLSHWSRRISYRDDLFQVYVPCQFWWVALRTNLPFYKMAVIILKIAQRHFYLGTSRRSIATVKVTFQQAIPLWRNSDTKTFQMAAMWVVMNVGELRVSFRSYYRYIQTSKSHAISERVMRQHSIRCATVHLLQSNLILKSIIIVDVILRFKNITYVNVVQAECSRKSSVWNKFIFYFLKSYFIIYNH